MFLCSNDSIIKIMSCDLELKSTSTYKTSVNYEVRFFDRDKKMAVILS